MNRIHAKDTTQHRIRIGLTLIELMVALVIISLLAGIALPSVKETIRGQKLSRAASLVQSIIQEGQARSISRGGGGGILIERLGDANIYERCQSVRIRLVDAPPIYTGDTSSATARYQRFDGVDPNNPYLDTHFLLFDPGQAQMIRSADDIANDPTVRTLINIDDTLRLSAQGLPMTIGSIARLPSSASWTPWQRDASDIAPPSFLTDSTQYVQVQVYPREYNTDLRRHAGHDVSFSITRSPRFAIANPLDLPTGTVIDLTASGIGRYGNDFSPMFIERYDVSGIYVPNYMDDSKAPFGVGPFDYDAIIVLFGSRGEVSRVLGNYWNTSTNSVVFGDIPVTGDIYLLVGEGGQLKPFPEEQLEDQDTNPLTDEASDGTTPLLNAESIWVTIKARSGEVITSAWTDPTNNSTNLIPPPIGTPDNDVERGNRIQQVIGLTRTGAIETQDTGSR